jgi:hypothetical protein
MQQRLRQAWPAPNLQEGFNAGRSGNLPVANDVWPFNIYMRHRDLRQLFTMREEFYKFELEGPPLDFFANAEYVPESRFQTVSEKNPEAYAKVLFLQGGLNSEMQSTPPLDSDLRAGFSYRFHQSDYNSFDFEATAPRAGWLLIRQLNDPRWRVILDGQRVSPVQANLVSMALFVTAGQHAIHMEYEPFARQLYWSACGLLILTLATLLFFSVLSEVKGHRQKLKAGLQ